MLWEFAPCNGNFWDKAGTSCSADPPDTAFCGVIHRSNPTNTQDGLTSSQYVVIESERGLFPQFPNFFRTRRRNGCIRPRKPHQTARNSPHQARFRRCTHDFPKSDSRRPGQHRPASGPRTEPSIPGQTRDRVTAATNPAANPAQGSGPGSGTRSAPGPLRKTG
jgi:hypothetical protein